LRLLLLYSTSTCSVVVCLDSKVESVFLCVNECLEIVLFAFKQKISLSIFRLYVYIDPSTTTISCYYIYIF
jgi:hypothetical protein